MGAAQSIESTMRASEKDLPAPRFPPPPRTPSLSTPAAAPAFQPEESPSFDKRLTPVIPASWPDEDAPTGSYTRLAPETPAEPSAQASRLISMSPAAATENAFWDAP